MSSEHTTPSRLSSAAGGAAGSSSWTEGGSPSFTDSTRSVAAGVTNFGQSATSSASPSEGVNHVTSIFVPGSDCVEFSTSASGGDVCCVLLFGFSYLRLIPNAQCLIDVFMFCYADHVVFFLFLFV